MLLQHGADPNIRNTDGKSALDLADPSAKAVLTGQTLAVNYHSGDRNVDLQMSSPSSWSFLCNNDATLASYLLDFNFNNYLRLL